MPPAFVENRIVSCGCVLLDFVAFPGRHEFSVKLGAGSM